MKYLTGGYNWSVVLRDLADRAAIECEEARSRDRDLCRRLMLVEAELQNLASCMEQEIDPV